MNKIILLNAIVGSQAYGTNTPDSDIDTKGVYLQDPMEVLGMVGENIVKTIIPTKLGWKKEIHKDM